VFPDLAVTLSQRRWACVIDPALLLLTPFGPTLVQRLGALTELWIPRSFWRVLDDSETCLRESKRLVPAAWLAAVDQDFGAVSRDALRTWERIRARTDLCGLRFRYLDDSLMLSAVPEQREPDLVQRFDQIEAALQRDLGSWPDGSADGHDAWLCAIDTLALATTLGAAFVLTLANRATSQPAPAAALEGFPRIPPFQRIDSDRALANLEYEQLARLAVQGGLAPLLWAGLDLAVAHVVAPATLQLRTAFDDMLHEEDEELVTLYGGPAGTDLWRHAAVYWYPL